MGIRRTVKEFRKNWGFIGVMILLALLAGVGAVFMSNELNVFLDQASLAQKLLNNPETLTEAEKTELKKAFPDKPSAEKYYGSLPQAEKENARKALDAMGEGKKRKYRELLQ